MRKKLIDAARRGWAALLADERGLTTLEYVIAAGIILVVLSAAILAWNNGLAAESTTRMIPAAITYSSVVRPRSSARSAVQPRRAATMSFFRMRFPPFRVAPGSR